uniref:Uncharacterized protein n=1 Tax=Anguilla anguilla TaxID=7936 RepID=A0A0E9UUW9_ANGAN
MFSSKTKQTLQVKKRQIGIFHKQLELINFKRDITVVRA